VCGRDEARRAGHGETAKGAHRSRAVQRRRRWQGYGSAVTPEGNYSFKIYGAENANGILTCMAGEEYSGKRTDFDQDHAERRRTGGEGEPSR
jgi:hypothetical protein